MRWLHLGVAQFGSVLEWGSRGRRFNSCHPDHEKRHLRMSFFSYICLAASYIASQLYSASPSDIVLRTVKGKYNITETDRFQYHF